MVTDVLIVFSVMAPVDEPLVLIGYALQSLTAEWMHDAHTGCLGFNVLTMYSLMSTLEPLRLVALHTGIDSRECSTRSGGLHREPANTALTSTNTGIATTLVLTVVFQCPNLDRSFTGNLQAQRKGFTNQPIFTR